MKLHRTLLILAAYAVTLGVGVGTVSLVTSCSSTGTNAPLVKLGEQLVVQYAVMKVVEQNPAHAARIVEIAAIVRAATAGDQTATVATIYALIESKIDRSKLKPSDVFLVDSLLTAMQVALNERVGTKPGMLPVDKLLAINEVASWIEAAVKAAVVR